MDDYTFRREFDFWSYFPDVLVDFKKSRRFRNMSLAEKYKLYDNLYYIHKKHFLSGYISNEEKSRIEEVAAQKIMERGLQELEKTLQ